MKIRGWLPRTGFALLLSSLIGCDVTGPDVRRFTAPVDSMIVPSTIVGSDSLEIRLFGSLPNSCYGIEGVDAEKTAEKVEITVRGTENIREGIGCYAAIKNWDWLLVVSPPYEDPFTVDVDQGDGTSMERVVMVR